MCEGKLKRKGDVRLVFGGLFKAINSTEKLAYSVLIHMKKWSAKKSILDNRN